MECFRATVVCFFLITQLSDVSCLEVDLLNYLFEPTRYSPHVRPTKHPEKRIDVHVELEMHFISSLDEKNQVLHTSGFLVAEWHDDFLKWNSSDYHGIEKIIVPPSKVWLPDFALVNSAGGVYDSLYTSHFRVHLDSHGMVIWMFGGNFATTCQLDLTYFPFDEQKCNFTVENWVYPATQVDLFNLTSEVVKDDFHENGEWTFTGSSVRKEYIQHDVFKNVNFPKITFQMDLKRKAGYYMLNIVTPCCMIIALALFMFWLPADSGEKVSLGITVLLAFSVFQLVIADNMPKTSDFTPLLSMYVAFIMGVSCISTILAIFSLYLHYKATDRRPNRILRIIFFNGFARIFCMTVPDTATIRCTPAGKDENVTNSDGNAFNNEGYIDETKVEKLPVGNAEDFVKPALPDTVTSLLHEIVDHIRHIKAKVKQDDHEESVSEEWKALARVIDRTCFWVSLVVIVAVCCDLFLVSALKSANSSNSH